MMRSIKLVCLGLLGMVLAIATEASARGPSPDAHAGDQSPRPESPHDNVADAASASSTQARKRAAQLYDIATEAVDGGKHRVAAELLEEAYALDPGMGTLFKLATCYEKLGRSASAWRRYGDVVSRAREQAEESDDTSYEDEQSRAELMRRRQAFAQQRADALKPKLVYLAVSLPSRALRARGLRVTLVPDPDAGASMRAPIEIGRDDLGSLQPVDPGRYRVVVTANRFEPRDATINTVGEGMHYTVTMTLGSQIARPTFAPEPVDPWTDARIAGATIMALGAAAVAAGSVMSFAYAGSDRTDAVPVALGAGTAALGTVALASGMLLVLTPTSQGQEPTVGVSLHGPGLRLAGSF